MSAYDKLHEDYREIDGYTERFITHIGDFTMGIQNATKNKKNLIDCQASWHPRVVLPCYSDDIIKSIIMPYEKAYICYKKLSAFKVMNAGPDLKLIFKEFLAILDKILLNVNAIVEDFNKHKYSDLLYETITRYSVPDLIEYQELSRLIATIKNEGDMSEKLHNIFEQQGQLLREEDIRVQLRITDSIFSNSNVGNSGNSVNQISVNSNLYSEVERILSDNKESSEESAKILIECQKLSDALQVQEVKPDEIQLKRQNFLLSIGKNVISAAAKIAIEKYIESYIKLHFGW